MANIYEIELKSVVEADQFNQLVKDMPSKCEPVKKELVFSMLFSPGHHALKVSDSDEREYVVKDDCGSMCKMVSRKSITKDEYADLAERLGKEKVMERQWATGKLIFSYPLAEHDYKVYVEAILKPGLYKPAAYVFKARHAGESPSLDEHVLNLRRIMVSLGVAPIPARRFEENLASSIRNKVNA